MDATAVESLKPVPLDAAASNSSYGSSSSNSSGYASATTTPTNLASNGNNGSHSQYSESHTTTPVGMVEPTPVATIAAVTPYYNETLQQNHQRQLQQYYSHLQQHHSSHSSTYQMTDQFHGSSYDSYTFLAGGDNPQSTSVERNLLDMRHTSAFYTELQKSSKITTQPTTRNHHVYNSESGLNNPNRSSETSTSVKPQATATPFYAQPLQTNSPTAIDPYLDPYRNKFSTNLPNHNIDYANYSNQSFDATNAAPYDYNFQQYYSGNTLQNVVHSTGSSQMKVPTPVTNARIPQQRLGVPFGNTAMAVGFTVGNTTGNNNNGGSTHLDKYLYTVVTTAAQSPFYTSTQPANLSALPSQYVGEIPNDTYHKTSTSSSWHWNMEYSNGNYRSQPRHITNIPTAAIPPTNASCMPPNTAASRDLYFTHEKYSNKYDKYNSYYNPHQQYMATNAVRHNVWPNSPHSTPHLVPALGDRLAHSYSHHTLVPQTGVPTSLAPSPTHPSLAYHHPFPPSAVSVNDRQNCCSQPYQQQNCCFPRTEHHPHLMRSTYNQHTQTAPYGTAGTASGNVNNTAGKYDMIDYGQGKKAKVNALDLYTATTPTYETTNMNYHSYPVGVTHNQPYANPLTPAALVSHQPFNPNNSPNSDISTVYYNDLNNQAAYMSPVQAPALLQRRENLVQHVERLPNLPTHDIQPSPVKSSLIDFRKVQATEDEDCFMAETTLTNLDEHMATNMSHYSSNFGLESGIRPSNENMYSQAATKESTDKTGTPTTPTTKTYSSLRDFLSTWNEDEEDYGFTDERNLSENESSQFVEETMGIEGKTNVADITNKIACVADLPSTPVSITPVSAQISRNPQQPSIENDLQTKGESNTLSKTQVDVNFDKSMEVATNQCININLPDIIIDIEKSSASTTALSSTAKVFTPHMNSKSANKDLHYDNFDVEKELDELETKRTELSRKPLTNRPPRTGSVIMKAETGAQEVQTETIAQKVIEDKVDTLESIKTPESFELISDSSYSVKTDKLGENATYSVNKSELTLSTVQTKPGTSYDRGIESDNTTSSNGSTFEKEYETFINKIGNDFDFKDDFSNEDNIETINMANELTDSDTFTNNVRTIEEEFSNSMNKTFDKYNSETDIDIAQKIQSFSKFYKRKRKYSDLRKYENENKMLNQGQVSVNDSNFPMVCTKRCRKRKGKNTQLKKITISFYQRALRSLRRQLNIRGKRLDTTLLIQQHNASVMGRRLPLIKNKVTKQISGGFQSKFKPFNPKTLKGLTICFINSELFQSKLLNITPLKNHINESKTTNTAPKKEIKNPIETLKTTPPPPNQVHANKINDECDKSADIFKESPVNKQLRNRTKTPKNWSDSETFIKVYEKRDEEVENHIAINMIVANMSNMQSDKSNNIENNFVDVPEDMEKMISEEKINTTGFIQSEKDIKSLRHLVAGSSKEVGVEEIESRNLEIFTNSPPQRKYKDQLENDVGAEIKNFTDSTKFRETERVGEERTGTSNFDRIHANRVSQTELQLEHPSEDITEKSPTYSDAIKVQEIQLVTEKFKNAEHEISKSENSTKETSVHLKKIVNANVEHNFENREHLLKDEEIRLNSIGENLHHLHSEGINNQRSKVNTEITDEEQSESSKLVSLEKKNCVDKFGARKSTEYFPVSQRGYFEKSVDFENTSLDCYSPSSSDSSITSCQHKSSTSSSSSSSSSSDEDTQCSTSTTHSDFNEMKELEKELSQNQASEPSNIKPIAKEKHTDATIYTQDNSKERTSHVSFTTVTENDIKTLKKILESDSDEHEEVEANLKNTHDNVHEDDRKAPANIGATVLEGEKYDARYKAEDIELVQREESVLFHNQSKAEKLMNVEDTLGYDLGNTCVETSRVESCSKSCEMEFSEIGLEVDENQSQIKYIFNESVESSKENRVPSLKQTLLDFFERKNSTEYHSRIHSTEDEPNSRIPKLSDLCKIALRSSFEISVPEKQQRELSVEEALAEMYRQAGVASDPEDGDTEEKEAQDVVLINLEEILVSDSDLYVLQCDMNENVLSVVTHPQEADLSMADDEDNNDARNGNCDDVKDVAQLRNFLQEGKVTNETKNLFGPYLNKDVGVLHSSNEVAMSFTALSPTLTTEVVEDLMMVDSVNSIHMDSLDTQFDFPAIHHEEIVSHDYRRLRRQVLYSSLREKYVLRRLNFGPYPGNRVLKKYIHRWILQCLIAKFRERELKKVQI